MPGPAALFPRAWAATALVEYDNTQDGANHAHSMWIDPQDVFGRHVLKTHNRGAH